MIVEDGPLVNREKPLFAGILAADDAL